MYNNNIQTHEYKLERFKTMLDCVVYIGQGFEVGGLLKS